MIHSVYDRVQEVSKDEEAKLKSNGRRSGTIWQTNTILKVKNFMWKFFSNSLLVMHNLRRRGMKVRAYSPACNMGEDREQMTCKCRWTEFVRFGTLGLSSPQLLAPKPTLEDWVKE